MHLSHGCFFQRVVTYLTRYSWHVLNYWGLGSFGQFDKWLLAALSTTAACQSMCAAAGGSTKARPCRRIRPIWFVGPCSTDHNNTRVGVMVSRHVTRGISCALSGDADPRSNLGLGLLFFFSFPHPASPGDLWCCWWPSFLITSEEGHNFLSLGQFYPRKIFTLCVCGLIYSVDSWV